jgi:hypothetical protein
MGFVISWKECPIMKWLFCYVSVPVSQVVDKRGRTGGVGNFRRGLRKWGYIMTV